MSRSVSSTVQVGGTLMNSVVMMPPAFSGGYCRRSVRASCAAPVEGRQQPRALGFRQVAEQHGLLVGRHGIEQRPRGPGIQRPDDRHPVLQLRIVEHLYREVERQGRDHPAGGLGREVSQGLGNVGRLHAGDDLGELGRIAGQQVAGVQGWRS